MGKLYICGTPIGNLEDVTVRLLKTLRQVDLIVCEDTRQTIKLLNRYKIKKPLLSYHEYSGPEREKQILSRLDEGKSVALVSDAGMPLISDPGSRLTQQAIAAGHALTVIPGPSAGIAALVLSGLATEAFIFMGFLPEKATQRRQALAALSQESRTVILYEAPHRLIKTLQDVVEILGTHRSIVVARELTKKFEELKRGAAEELLRYYEEYPPRGEICLIIGGCQQEQVSKSLTEILVEVEQLMAEGKTKKEALKIKASEYHIAKSLLYNEMIKLETESTEN